MGIFFKKKADKDMSVEDRAQKHADVTREMLDRWFNLTVTLIRDQFKQISKHVPIEYAVREKLENDPDFKARVIANLQLDCNGCFDCEELAQLRDEIERANDASDVVLENEYAVIAAKLEAAYAADKRTLLALPHAPIDQFTPYFDMDFVKSYLKI